MLEKGGFRGGAQFLEDSRRGKSVEDLELRDDGSNPLKLMPECTKDAIVPKKIIFWG